MKTKKKDSGFTLIELITVLVLIGIVGVFGGLLLVKMVQSYRWAEDNAHIAQKTQVALTRIASELSRVEKFDYNCRTANQLSYTYNNNEITIFRNDSNELVYQVNSAPENVLLDKVTSLEVSAPANGICQIELKITGSNNAERELALAVAPYDEHN